MKAVSQTEAKFCTLASSISLTLSLRNELTFQFPIPSLFYDCRLRVAFDKPHRIKALCTVRVHLPEALQEQLGPSNCGQLPGETVLNFSNGSSA